jgi:integrase
VGLDRHQSHPARNTPVGPRVGRKIATPEIVSRLLEETRPSRNPENHIAFRLLAATGARRGEMCALRWTSVDFDRSRIEISGPSAAPQFAASVSSGCVFFGCHTEILQAK